MARTTVRISKDQRRSKLAAAFAWSVLVGVGAYALTYRALVLVSEPATTLSVAPVSSVSPAVPHVSTPASHPVR